MNGIKGYISIREALSKTTRWASGSKEAVADEEK